MPTHTGGASDGFIAPTHSLRGSLLVLVLVYSIDVEQLRDEYFEFVGESVKRLCLGNEAGHVIRGRNPDACFALINRVGTQRVFCKDLRSAPCS